MVIVRLRAMFSVCLRAMLRPLKMPMPLLPRINHLNRPWSFWLRLCKLLRLLWQRNRLRYLAQLLRSCQTKANLRRPLARPVQWPLGAFPRCYLHKVGQLFLFLLLCRPFAPDPLAFTVHFQHGDHVVPRKRFICCHVARGQHFVSDFAPRAEPALHCRSWLLPRSCESSRPSGGGEVH